MARRGGDRSSEARVLALATRRAVQAAGGLELCAAETRIGKSQLARCTSTSRADSLTEIDAHTIDALAGDVEGAPFILSARARLLGFILVRLDEGDDDEAGLMLSIAEIAAELGDLSRAVAEAVRRPGKVTKDEAIAALDELEQLERKCAVLRRKLVRLVEGRG